MKEIKLTKENVTLVSDEDYEYLKNHKWHCDNKGYAVRSIRDVNNNYRKQYMHRLIMGMDDTSWKVCKISHKDGNRLNNQIDNLLKSNAYFNKYSVNLKSDLKQKILDNIIINDTSGCWEWQKGTDGRGYGSFIISGESKKAHRVSYEVFKDKIPKGLCILHSCDNPPCCNPEHLTVGTHADNLRDMFSKGRNKLCRGEDNGRAKLNASQVLAIMTTKGTNKELSKMFNIGTTAISDIKCGKSWKCVTGGGILN